MAQLNDLLVMGQSTLLGPATIHGAVNMGSTLTVAGATTIKGATKIYASNFTIYSNQGSTSKFSVTASNGNTSIAGTLGVTGATSLSSTLTVTGATTLSSTLDVSSNASIGGTLGVTGDITASGTGTQDFSAGTLKFDTINIPKTSTSTTDYGPGTSGQVLKSNGSIVYWGSDNNTTYSPFTGASSSNDGLSGLVPKPLKADRTKFLKGDGTWATVSTSDTNVTQTADSSTTADKSVILCNVASSGTAGTVSYCPSVQVKPSEGKLTASKFNASSDRRLKENLLSFTPQKSILDLPIYKFDFINGAKNQIGCMAQDLQQICPELVEENANGYLTIQEGKLIYLLLDEVKKLKVQIQMLGGNV